MTDDSQEKPPLARTDHLRALFPKRHSAEALDAIKAAFPPELEADVEQVMQWLGEPEHKSCGETRFLVNGSEVAIPYRVYFPAVSPTSETPSAPLHRAILAAILTRHRLGFQREPWTRELTAFPAPWAVPFLALLLEDQVRQVVSVVDEHMSDEWIPLLRKFSAENPHWSRTCNHRIVSCWDFYRHLYPRITDYPAYRVMEKLGLWNRKTCPKLLARCRRMENKR